MERPLDMMDAVRLGDVGAAALFIQQGAGPEHTNGELYLCEAVCGQWSAEMLDLLLANGSDLFALDVYGVSAVQYALRMGNVEIMAYMHEKIPGIASSEIIIHDMPRTVTQAATGYAHPEMLLFLYENGGVLHYGSCYLKKIVHSMWMMMSARDTEKQLVDVLRKSVQCIAACILLGQDPNFYIPRASTALELYMQVPIKADLFPTASALHREYGELIEKMPILRANYAHLKHPVFERNAEVWRYAVDRRIFRAWAKKQRETARRCYAALYFGTGETAQGRAPIRALCDADTVRELLTLFLVFPKRRMLALF
jgi:hypothetical protein